MPTAANSPDSVYRTAEHHNDSDPIESTLEAYIKYSLFHSPQVERSYQDWRASSERLPQVRSLPDQRLKLGFFINEVETRVGAQQAKVGIEQSFPWIGTLKGREDSAARSALAAWYRFQNTQLLVAEQVSIAMHELAYLDRAIEITRENETLIRSIEEVIRAKYRVGSGSHPELIRVHIELAEINNRLIGLEAWRPSQVANLNSALNRPPQTDIPNDFMVPQLRITESAAALTKIAQDNNPLLQAAEQLIERSRIETELAHKDGYPNLSVGLEYIATDEASNSSIAESGDDPVMLTFGISLPIWREKYDAGVRESIAHRLSVSRDFDAQSNTISARIYKAWFEHSDADRRVTLYEDSLIPKAQELFSASLGGFRAGKLDYLDLLDTQQTLLELSISAQRARADRGNALATMNRLVGITVQTQNTALNTHGNTQTTHTLNEAQP
jgi:outer membrane protein TolC